MKPELEQEIIKLIGSAKEVLPEIATEYLEWHYLMASVGLFLSLTFLLIGVISITKGALEGFSSTNGYKFTFAAVNLVFVTFGLVGGIINTCEIIKIDNAPRIYLIDALKGKK